jgi:hypothetical protein
MSGRIDRLRKRIGSIKRRTSTTIEREDEHNPTPDIHPTPDIIPVSIEHGHNDANQRALTTASEGFNAAAAAITSNSNSVGFKAAAAAAITSVTTATQNKSFEEGTPSMFQQQYDDVWNRLIVSSPKETEVSSMPSFNHSTVNYFEPSVENVDAHTYACDKMSHSPTCPKQTTTECKSSSSFVVNEISLVDMDDVSDIENPDHFEEGEKNVCLQVLNENLCPNTQPQSDQMLDNDIISLPHLMVVTPEDGGRNNNDSKRNSSRQTPCLLGTDANLQTYIGDSYNDIIQALSNNMRGCGLDETYVALDEIRNGLFQ